MRTLKMEQVYLSEYQDLVDVCWQIGHMLEEIYNGKMPHYSLGYLPPSHFEAGIGVEEEEDKRHPDRSTVGVPVSAPPLAPATTL